MHNESDACVECGGTTEVIKIVDATQPGMLIGATDETSAASHHIQLQYTAEDATRSAWSKQFPTAGHLRGKMCTDCGRVVLYAIPKAKDSRA